MLCLKSIIAYTVWSKTTDRCEWFNNLETEKKLVLWLKIKLRYGVQIKWEHSRYHTYIIPQIEHCIENVKINGLLIHDQETNRK